MHVFLFPIIEMFQWILLFFQTASPHVCMLSASVMLSLKSASTSSGARPAATSVVSVLKLCSTVTFFTTMINNCHWKKPAESFLSRNFCFLFWPNNQYFQCATALCGRSQFTFSHTLSSLTLLWHVKCTLAHWHTSSVLHLISLWLAPPCRSASPSWYRKTSQLYSSFSKSGCPLVSSSASVWSVLLLSQPWILYLWAHYAHVTTPDHTEAQNKYVSFQSMFCLFVPRPTQWYKTLLAFFLRHMRSHS